MVQATLHQTMQRTAYQPGFQSIVTLEYRVGLCLVQDDEDWVLEREQILNCQSRQSHPLSIVLLLDVRDVPVVARSKDDAMRMP